MMTRLSICGRCLGTVFLATSLLAPRGILAQEKAPAPKRIEVGITYSAIHANVTDGSGFWAQGGAFDADVAVAHHFSLAAELNGAHTGNAATSKAPFSLLTVVFGPRYSWTVPHDAKKKTRIDLFGQGLFGVAHEFDSVLPSGNSASSFALQLGGGVDVGITPSFAVRAVEADWLHTQLPNAANGAQNSFRIATGILYRF